MRESAGAWTQRPTARRTCRVAAALVFFAAWVVPAFPARAADLEDALKRFQSCKYEDGAEACADAVRRSRPDEGWPLLKIRAQLATGKYAEALATYESATARNDRSIPLLLLGYD